MTNHNKFLDIDDQNYKEEVVMASDSHIERITTIDCVGVCRLWIFFILMRL